MGAIATTRLHRRCFLSLGGTPALAVFAPALSQVAIYASGSQLEWREVEGGELPSRSNELRAALVADVLFVTGVYDGDYLTSILSWDPVAQSWQPAGDLAVARVFHAAVALPSSVVDCQL